MDGFKFVSIFGYNKKCSDSPSVFYFTLVLVIALILILILGLVFLTYKYFVKRSTQNENIDNEDKLDSSHNLTAHLK